jgi:WD40 repeat protein
MGVSAVAFSAGDKHIISSSLDGTMRLWDTKSGEELKRFEDEDILYFSASPAGDRILLSTTNKNTILLDGEFNQLKAFNKVSYPSVALSPNGKWAAIAKDRTIGLWDIETGEEIRTLQGLDELVTMAFNDDGSQILSSYYNGEILIWDTETGGQTVVTRRTHGFPLAFVPGTDRVLTIDLPRMTLWDNSERKPVSNEIYSKKIVQYDANNSFYSIAFNHDGTQFLLPMYDGTIQLWDASIWH